ncbi:bacteriophage abortive infection AbiH family protein [Chryseobacterium gregarium]|uniref:bacteriophage abortive infection AbiH family protein n=1 Tax=Chryseobacterium gregarium TaxID=456299 RepID=UPI0004112856|nr:bacteriophage abortive infection AbiH family protein [Chryseobacterium gregarium]
MRLYLIGNGFDITHNLNCKYCHFHTYLKNHRYDVLDCMAKFYDIEEDSELWSDFETNLEKNIVYESLKDIIGDNTPNFMSDDFRDGDWYDAEISVEQECDELLQYIRNGFEEWIISLEVDLLSKKFNLKNDDFYITFNYTETLERIYEILDSNILHIHHKVGEKLIFGHGKKTDAFNVREALYGDQNIFEEVDEYGNVESSEIGHEKFAENAVIAFYDKMRKPTEEVINHNHLFFSKLSPIEEVIIWGLSYSDVDFPYIEKVLNSVNENVIWTLSYFSETDKHNAIRTMQRLGVDESLYIIKYCLDLEKELNLN